MVITGTEQVSSEVIKISSDKGLAFFIRTCFLNYVNPNEIVENAEFLDDKEDDIIDAGMIYACECKACEYLSRSEQCKFNLTKKLLAKNYEKRYIEVALDYLERKNYLNDRRFSLSWLNSRKINHFEGRTRLLAELLARGIKKDDANSALDDFFEENDEEEICKKALEKYRRQGKTNENLINSLMKAGFSYSMVKNLLCV